MIQYKGLNLYSKKECDLLGKNVEGCEPLFIHLYLDPYTRVEDLAKAIELDCIGSYDLAVPQSWAEKNNFPRGYDSAIWFYPHTGEGHLFGKPLTVREMVNMLWEAIKRDHSEDFFTWIYKEWKEWEVLE
jgi:hypothetical protein